MGPWCSPPTPPLLAVTRLGGVDIVLAEEWRGHDGCGEFDVETPLQARLGPRCFAVGRAERPGARGHRLVVVVLVLARLRHLGARVRVSARGDGMFVVQPG